MGLKSGTGDGAVDSDTTSESPSREPDPETSSGSRPDRTVTSEPDTRTDDGQSLLERRDSVKDERELMQFFLRPDVYDENTENRLKADVGDRLGEAPYAFDLREALVAVGQRHKDEVVAELQEMGYE